MKATLLWFMILVAAVTGYTFFKMIGWREQARSMSRYDRLDYAKLAEEKKLEPGEFVLTDQNSQLFTSDQLRGKVWVLSFFFQNCNKECLELNRKLAELQQEFKDPDLHFVSISCNPEIDTPSDLQRYQQGFHGDPLRWHMLTGNFDYIAKNIAAEVNLPYKLSDHSQYIVVFGRDGQRKKYAALLRGNEEDRAAEMKEIKEVIQKALAEPAPNQKPAAEQKPAEQKPEVLQNPAEQPVKAEEKPAQVPAPDSNKQSRRAAPLRQLAGVPARQLAEVAR